MLGTMMEFIRIALMLRMGIFVVSSRIDESLLESEILINIQSIV